MDTNAVLAFYDALEEVATVTNSYIVAWRYKGSTGGNVKSFGSYEDAENFLTSIHAAFSMDYKFITCPRD